MINSTDSAGSAARLAELVAHEDWETATPRAALKLLGELIDLGSIRRDENALNRAVLVSRSLEARTAPSDLPVLFYYQSNAWADLAILRKRDQWAWDQPELQEQVLLLRRAIADSAFSKLHVVRRAQILTNLGNALSTLGRVAEAIEYRDRALEAKPNFAMALGTRAESLVAYGMRLYRKVDQRAFFSAAGKGYASATDADAFYEADYSTVKAQWVDQRDKWRQWLSEQAPLPPATPRPASSDVECAYSAWCTAQRLFLDPLNDLGTPEIAMADRLHLPAIVPHNAQSEMLMAYLDSMQQEFASARWNLYEALTGRNWHFSDAGLAPHDTGDEPVYGLRVEQVKSTYRTAYSIFDKISFFLDAYFELNIKRVSFRDVWEKTRRTPFAGRQNWPLRGLFWLSRDLFEPDFIVVTEPEARELTAIRNHLEHKYLRVVRDDASEDRLVVNASPFIYIVKQRELEAHTVYLLKLARAALIYLVLALHAEERRKHEAGVQGPKTTLPTGYEHRRRHP